MFVGLIIILTSYSIVPAKMKISDLTMANIEALASPESGTTYVTCFAVISYPTPDDYRKNPNLYPYVSVCSPCGNLVYVKEAVNNGTCTYYSR